MKKILLSMCFVLLCCGLKAQHYRNSVGIRTGYTSSITYKRLFENNQAIELLASGRNNGLQVTTLYQFNKPMELNFNDNFFAYYGVGASLGYEKYQGFRTEVGNSGNTIIDGRKTYFTMGINTILGVEYRWLAVPITINVDIKPFFQFIGMQFTETRFWDAGLSVKYVF